MYDVPLFDVTWPVRAIEWQSSLLTQLPTVFCEAIVSTNLYLVGFWGCHRWRKSETVSAWLAGCALSTCPAADAVADEAVVTSRAAARACAAPTNEREAAPPGCASLARCQTRSVRDRRRHHAVSRYSARLVATLRENCSSAPRVASLFSLVTSPHRPAYWFWCWVLVTRLFALGSAVNYDLRPSSLLLIRQFGNISLSTNAH